jgi:hypothetical protein
LRVVRFQCLACSVEHILKFYRDSFTGELAARWPSPGTRS